MITNPLFYYFVWLVLADIVRCIESLRGWKEKSANNIK